MRNRSHIGAVIAVSFLLTSFGLAQGPAVTGAAPPASLANGSSVCRTQADARQACSADATVAAKSPKDPVLLAQATASAIAPPDATPQLATASGAPQPATASAVAPSATAPAAPPDPPPPPAVLPTP